MTTITTKVKEMLSNHSRSEIFDYLTSLEDTLQGATMSEEHNPLAEIEELKKIITNFLSEDALKECNVILKRINIEKKKDGAPEGCAWYGPSDSYMVLD